MEVKADVDGLFHGNPSYPPNALTHPLPISHLHPFKLNPPKYPSYVILVNPQILSLTSIPSSDSVFATCLSSAVGSILCGLIGNLPFALAPGMGLSAYLVYGLVLGDVLTLREALTSVLVSGFLQIAFAVTGVSKVIMGVVPRGVKMAIVVGMGILVSMIGMVSVKLVVKNDKTLVGMGDLTGELGGRERGKGGGGADEI